MPATWHPEHRLYSESLCTTSESGLAESPSTVTTKGAPPRLFLREDGRVNSTELPSSLWAEARPEDEGFVTSGARSPHSMSARAPETERTGSEVPEESGQEPKGTEDVTVGRGSGPGPPPAQLGKRAGFPALEPKGTRKRAARKSPQLQNKTHSKSGKTEPQSEGEGAG